MSKVPWVPHKEIDFSHIQELLAPSIRSNQLTNYGPAVFKLEEFFRNKLEVSPDRCIIAVSNGAAGLHALVAGINLYRGRRLKYATQAFTFPCSAQGILENSLIVDIGDDMGPNLDELTPDIDGIIVTNLFGHVVDIQKYVNWTHHNQTQDNQTQDNQTVTSVGYAPRSGQRVLIFDNATVFSVAYNGINAVNYGDGCIISLHHTKPIGYGEGGLIIADKKYESYIRKCINFGFEIIQGRLSWQSMGSNYKMSDISAVFILDYIMRNYDSIVDTHKKLYKAFLDKIVDIQGITQFPNYSSNIPCVNCIPILFDKEITTDHLYQLELHGITARKYYTPLLPKENSMRIYKRILCLPCHREIDLITIDRYVRLIQQI